MPTYDYKCEQCGVTIEFERGFGEDREPTCCQTIMTRVWSAPAVKFNGSGFYSTGGQMTEDEMQDLQESIKQGIEEYFEAYDWDSKFKQYLEER